MDMQSTPAGKRGPSEQLTVKEIVAISGWLSANAETMKVSTRAQRCEALQKATNVAATEAQLSRVEEQLGFTNWERPPATCAAGGAGKRTAFRRMREDLDAAVALLEQQAQQIEALQRHCKLHPSAH